ncbi:OmpA family protein [Neptunicella sp. SCSIO 80796]|uniref:OmpA family protein n=1 Tax=Neptunicella plasticusilytica TaxID=3117012 RepID=UPI003A4D5240
MSQSSAANKTLQDQQQLEELRALILGNDRQLVTDTVRQQARELVGEVVSEALHDRQKQDGSINKVLQPIVETSVERSVSSHSEKLVGYLYPLVGSLVRKAVSAFLNDFIDKTNQLLENSLTIRGLKWRFKAWQAGVSFAQYVASETFVYRVEHLLLIHRQTGLLLRSVDYQPHSRGDADLISSMLGAINDFVSDSFAPGEEGQEEQLQKISTDNFTLLIKPGPLALVVAAVTGKAPSSVSEQMQITLEDIHRLYADDLQSFQGDASPFENAEAQLRDCLLAEHKAGHDDKQKPFPWKAWLLLFIVIGLASKWGFGQWQQHQLVQHIHQLDLQPGIIVKDVTLQDSQHVSIDLMRDPAAIEVTDWLAAQGLDYLVVSLNERGYRSADQQIIHSKVDRLLSAYDGLRYQWQDAQLILAGSLDVAERDSLLTELAALGYLPQQNLQLAQLDLKTDNSAPSNQELKRQVFARLVGLIAASQLGFAVDSSQISQSMRVELQNVASRYLRLKHLAAQLGYQVDGLVVMGASDNTGSTQKNYNLSQKRANNTAKVLTESGIAQQDLFATGLGEIELGAVTSATRKVMFSVMYTEITLSPPSGNTP